MSMSPTDRTHNRFPMTIIDIIVRYVDYDVVTEFIMDNLKKIDSSHFSANGSAPISLLMGDIKDERIPEGWKMSWKWFSGSPNITSDLLERGKGELDWYNLCENPNVPLDFLKRNMEKVCWNPIFLNKGIPLTPEGVAFLDENMKENNGSSYAFNSNTPFKLLMKHNVINKYIWRVKDIPIDYLRENISKIDWGQLASNEGIPRTPEGMKFLEENIESLLGSCIYSNTSIPLSFFEKNIEKIRWSYEWSRLCSNSSIPTEFLEKHIERVDWTDVWMNPRISTLFMDKYVDKIPESCWRYIWDYNMNITPGFVKKYGSRVCWKSLSGNKHIFRTAARDELLTLLEKIL